MDVLLYSAKGSNCSERVQWVLNFKRIPYQRIEVSSQELGSSYLTVNPFGYVPSLSVDGLVFSESMAIVEYLEERFTDIPLLGNNLNEKTHIRRVCEYVNGSIHSPQNKTVLKFFRPDLDDSSKRQLRGEWITHCLDKLSASICHDSGYVIGHNFSLADIFVASIYKKARQHGAAGHEFYHQHLMFIRNNEQVARAEPPEDKPHE
ncbi:glutathione S-transferase family protein [Vibrio spartinae]|uniref:Maleylpyruvate isomerase n=1 Tax=Vibrio spartinae TaxID=1918945 RepID=A0A1N6M738_9VIBR|nr:glutathione S-transferase family protein [Vibrio spartinae]QMV14002.1 Maleylpyruvate isomerase [Vibrio spartinae]SIO95271.1 Maleylpyruvate isomerase [Vibrio spartinae]